MHAVGSCCFPWKNCKNVKCSTIACKLEDIMLKGEYFVNVSTRIWNGTFAAVSISCIFMKDPILRYFLTPDIFQCSVKKSSNLERASFMFLCVFFKIENKNIKVVRLHMELITFSPAQNLRKCCDDAIFTAEKNIFCIC